MAKTQINTKSSAYLREKEVFLKDLKQFNDSKSIPFKTPHVNGVEIDLYHFFSLVQQRGGFSKVNINGLWESLLRPLHLPYPCINGSTLLRKIYGMYLEKYDKAKGPPSRDDDNDMDDDPRSARRGGTPRTTFTGGTYISASGEALRTGSRTIAGPSERLCLSLISPMPNEQDFAVNVCTVLAADHSNRLPLATSPHILDFLLAHAGVYNHSSLRDTIGRSYYEARGRYPDEFWRLRAGGGGAKELADESKFTQPGLEQPELTVQALAAHNTLTDCLAMGGDVQEHIDKLIRERERIEDWVSEPSEEDQLFASELPGGASCVYTQRVLQIASIVRSLSFHEENVQYLAKNTTLIRFLLLCANCWVGTLRQSGLDALGNVATELVIKDPATCLISRHVLSTVHAALVSSDRARVLAALELLNKLAGNEANEDALLKATEEKVYSDVCALLTLRDIMVLVCTLECVYALTSLGARASEAVSRVPGLVHTLVSLATVEAQSYGPRACILMRVVETVSGPVPATNDKDAQAQNTSQATPQTAPQAQSATAAAAVVAQPTPQPKVENFTTPVATSQPPTSVTSSSPMSTIQQSHTQQRTVQENEHFAQAWLRSSYEPLPPADHSAIDAAEVYRQYLACCGKLGRKGVIAPAHFPRLVRTVFGGTVGPNTITIASGETQQAYVGIRAKNVQGRSNPPGPASPILKAQLTNKPGAVEVKTVVTQPQQTQPQPSPLTQALESQTNTSLIKHLLAHKVSPATTTHAQVTQRQQSQQQRPSNTVVVHNTGGTPLEVDPESLIKCTTIIPGGIAATSQVADDNIVPKEEPVQIQIDEQAQLTIKSAQNKMLADLLEKKSNPPVQVVQMGQQINAPTIQITETGQILQVKSDPTPVIQINPEPSNQYYQIKNEQGQIIHIKNEHGQIIQLKSDQLQTPILVKNEQGQILQLKADQIIQGGIIQGGQILQGGQLMQSVIQGVVKTDKDLVEVVNTDHSYTEPPNKKMKFDDKRESNASPQESVSKTAANLYAALAASALEDEDDLIQPKQEEVQQQVLVAGPSDAAPVIIQEPILHVQQQAMQVPQQTLQLQQPTLQLQQPTLQMQQPTLQMQQQTLQMQQSTLQMQQQTLQMQQPMLQVQPMDVQNIIASQAGGQIIIHEKPVVSQQTQFMQQPMQIIASPGTSQGGLSYITQNIPGNMMQKTIIIVQGSAGGGPLTLTVNNPGGLDEATLNSVIAQATEAITQQQIKQNSGVIQSTQRVIVSQPTLVAPSQPMTIVKTALAQNVSQMTQSQQPIITTQPQPHKAQIVNQQQQIVVTNKNPPALINTSNNQIVTSNQQIIQGGQQLLQGGQQIIAVSKNQQILVNSPMKQTVHRVVTQRLSQDGKASVIQANTQKPQQAGTRQVITRQPVMVGNTKIGDKETIVTQAEPPAPKPTPTPPPQPQTTSNNNQNQQQPQPLQPVGPDDTPWICHWKGCGKVFENASEVFNHAAKTHCPTVAGGEAPCMWLDCDRVPRKTFALLNHITDKHCTPQALKAIFNSRRHAAAEAEASKPVTLGYPPNAALSALNKHAADMFNPRELMHRAELGRTPEQLDENEGPVTKSIRLTAALILRNLVIYSNNGRRQLRSYEAHLSTIAMSSVEASRTIAQVLYDMNNI